VRALSLLTVNTTIINFTIMLIKPEISWTDFEKIDIRCGTIISVNDFEKARNPSYQLEIDFGEQLGIKKSSAQITSLYEKDELIGKQILAVVNFPKKQIANFFSECLVLGVYGEDKKDVTLLTASLPVKNGMQVG
jgi:tRNA-binding protein